MRVLILGYTPSPLLETILAHGPVEVQQTEAPLDHASFGNAAPDYVISYGYRHMVKEAQLALLPGRVINLHISLLPWNRGADPNFWSFYDATPKGVTMHLMDKGVDTGDILIQREVLMVARQETLATAYARLQQAILDLFRAAWPVFLAGKLEPKPQPKGGSFHRRSDLEPLRHLLRDRGWDTPAEAIEMAGATARGRT